MTVDISAVSAGDRATASNCISGKKLKLALSDALAKRRKKRNSTQAQLAKLLNSSQSRVAKMEKGYPTLSVDLLVKSLLALGADKKSIARAIA